MCIQRNGRNEVANATTSGGTRNPRPETIRGSARHGTTHGSASSIGLAWPPRHDAWNSRVKGFYPCLVENTQDALKMGNEISDAWQQYRTSSTRLTARVIVRDSLDLHAHYDSDADQVVQRHSAGLNDQYITGEWNDMGRPLVALQHQVGRTVGIEARIDIGHVLPGFSILYIGYNAAAREIDPAIRRTEEEAIRGINQEINPTTPAEAYARLERANLRIERLMHPSADEVAQITSLYQQAFQKYLFDINTDSIGEIVDNSNLALIGRNQRGDIISSLIAEHVKIRLDGRDVHLIELSEFATDREYRGHGLMTALQFRALEMLRDLYDPRSAVIYIEGRAPWMPVNISIRRTGAIHCGIVNQHCVIVSDRSPGMQYTGDYEDLSVWVHKPQ